ncbi:MAG: cupin [Azospirillum sp.]|nr:cupin [Azospirillum sp.]
MSDQRVNADFARRVVIATDRLPWLASPQPGVERRLLDRIGGEVARATSLVRYAPSSRFPAHVHDLGEEFLVLDGVFSDEHGDYPAGTYVRNPPGSGHAPRTGPGCTILVKLRQMPPAERERIVIDTTRAPWQDGSPAGRSLITLYAAPDGERVCLERLAPGTVLAGPDGRGGEELLVIDGALCDALGRYGRGSWIRIPDGEVPQWYTVEGATCWIKRGHLPHR